MKKIVGIFLFAGFISMANAVVIDFAGGIAHLSTGADVVTNNTSPYLSNVDYYIEDGIKIDFIGGYGIIGNYYGSPGFGHPEIQNSVIHAHWGPISAVVFSKVDGSNMDLNYMDLTSNTTVGGGLATGLERSYVTSSKGTMLLPTSDWGVGFLSNGQPDNDVNGIERLWMSSDFDDISSFTVTSQNAYCFGLDNFYIDEPAPPAVPEPGTILLLGLGLFGIALLKKKK